MDKSPHWDDLRYFLALFERGTLSAAARTLAVEHTTVARRIDALETALGARLFDRFARGWTPTATGVALLPAARRVEAELHGVWRAASAGGAVRGTVRVSAPPALCAWLLAPAMPALLTRQPELEVELRGEARMADLLRGETDIALRFRRPASPGLALRRLTDVGYGVYASARYLATHAPRDWQFLGYDETLGETPQQQWLERFAGARRHRLRSNDLGTLYQAARSGAGVAVLPDYFAEAPAGGLAPAPGARCPITRPLWLVMHEDVRRAPPVRAVADALVDWFRRRQERRPRPGARRGAVRALKGRRSSSAEEER